MSLGQPQLIINEIKRESNEAMDPELSAAMEEHEFICPSSRPDTAAGVGTGVEDVNCQLAPKMGKIDSINFLAEFTSTLNATKAVEKQIKEWVHKDTQVKDYYVAQREKATMACNFLKKRVGNTEASVRLRNTSALRNCISGNPTSGPHGETLAFAKVIEVRSRWCNPAE